MTAVTPPTEVALLLPKFNLAVEAAAALSFLVIDRAADPSVVSICCLDVTLAIALAVILFPIRNCPELVTFILSPPAVSTETVSAAGNLIFVFVSPP